MGLHCLGTAGYHPNEQRHTSCYFVPEKALLLDAGSGLFRIGPLLVQEELTILLSHAHLDHIIGLTFFLDLVATTPLKRIRVIGEQEKLQAIKDHLFATLIFPVLPPIDWVPLEILPSSLEIAGAKITWFPLEHPGGSVGYRICWPNFTLGFVTDTHATATSKYWDGVRDVDLLIHECNFPIERRDFAQSTGHSCPDVVIESARKAGVKKLIMTHFDPLQVSKITQEIETIAALQNTMSVRCARDNDILPLDRNSRD